ncbi:MAG: gamma-glutamyl-gamma-aminobutyrate hydrolase family protein [Acidimicrobiales bacterium]
MNLPRIGLTTYVEDARWGVWAEQAALLPTTYVATVAVAGGLPVLLPPIVPGDIDVAAGAALAGIDGLVLTGGSDVDPSHYDTAAHPATDAPQPDRDAWELALLRAAGAADRPVLAVCRGVQLLNVAHGGTLHQHLPDVLGRSTHRPELGAYAHLTVEVDVDSHLAAIIGTSPEVHCHHHQAIDRLGEGLTVCARAADGTIEAVELAGPRFAIGVQWHPEEDGEDRLFSALIEAAAVPAA